MAILILKAQLRAFAHGESAWLAALALNSARRCWKKAAAAVGAVLDCVLPIMPATDRPWCSSNRLSAR